MMHFGGYIQKVGAVWAPGVVRSGVSTAAHGAAGASRDGPSRYWEAHFSCPDPKLALSPLAFPGRGQLGWGTFGQSPKHHCLSHPWSMVAGCSWQALCPGQKHHVWPRATPEPHPSHLSGGMAVPACLLCGAQSAALESL